MNEKELLNLLSSLKKIEPRKDWVLLTKNQILAPSKENLVGQKWQVGHVIDTLTFIFKKPAFAIAGFGLIIFLGVLLQLNQQRLAQDAASHLVLAQERLEAVQKIAESATKDKGNLAQALREFQETSTKLSKEVPQFAAKNRRAALQVGIGIIQLQKSAKGLEQVFGVAVGEETSKELENAAKTVVQNEIQDLSSRELNTLQQTLLQEAKSAFGQGDYETALERIWRISNAAD